MDVGVAEPVAARHLTARAAGTALGVAVALVALIGPVPVRPVGPASLVARVNAHGELQIEPLGVFASTPTFDAGDHVDGTVLVRNQTARPLRVGARVSTDGEPLTDLLATVASPAGPLWRGHPGGPWHAATLVLDPGERRQLTVVVRPAGTPAGRLEVVLELRTRPVSA